MNRVGHARATGAVEVRGGGSIARERLVVRERGAVRTYRVVSARYTASANAFRLEALRPGPVPQHVKEWTTCAFCVPFFGCAGCVDHRKVWTTQVCHAANLTAEAWFDPTGRAVAAAPPHRWRAGGGSSTL